MYPSLCGWRRRRLTSYSDSLLHLQLPAAFILSCCCWWSEVLLSCSPSELQDTESRITRCRRGGGGSHQPQLLLLSSLCTVLCKKRPVAFQWVFLFCYFIHLWFFRDVILLIIMNWLGVSEDRVCFTRSTGRASSNNSRWALHIRWNRKLPPMKKMKRVGDSVLSSVELELCNSSDCGAALSEQRERERN